MGFQVDVVPHFLNGTVHHHDLKNLGVSTSVTPQNRVLAVRHRRICRPDVRVEIISNEHAVIIIGKIIARGVAVCVGP